MAYLEHTRQVRRPARSDDWYGTQTRDEPMYGDHERKAWADPSTALDPVTGRVLPAELEARPRASVLAVLGLSAALGGLFLTLTGLLAPEGLAVGGLGVLLCLAGLIRAGRPGIAGRGVATVGCLVAICAVVLAVLAMSGRYAWLDSGTNRVADAHRWLVNHWSWLDRWS